MFISRIKTTNFGAARNKEIHLVDGLVVVRGENGIGKSSLIYQAPMYAFFGSTTLDGTMEETVTEGEKPGSLQVEVDYGPYTWKRSKGSASVVGSGIQISGQAEVTAFSEQLFGISKDSAEMVLVSKQGESSGLVKKKGAAINQFIEEAADFQQLEDIIERAKSLYPHGYVEVYEESIIQASKAEETLEEEIDRLEGEETQKVFNTVGVQEELEEENANEVMLRSEIAVIEAGVLQIQQHNQQITKAEEAVAAEGETLKNLLGKIGALENKEYRTFIKEDLEAAEDYIAKFPSMQEEWLEYKKFLGMKLEEPFWEGDEKNFLAELDLQKADRDLFQERVNELKSDIRVWESKISSTFVCATCGSDITHKVAEINALAEEGIAKSKVELEEAELHLKRAKSDLDQLEQIKRKHKKVTSNFITFDENTIPFTAKWEREIPTEPDQNKFRSSNELLQSRRNTLKDIDTDKERVKELEEFYDAGKVRLDKLIEGLKALGDRQDSSTLSQELSGLVSKYTELLVRLGALTKREKTLETRLTEIKTEIKEKKAQLVKLAESVKDLSEKIKLDKENTRFLKVLRETKPKVLQKVWHSILAVIETPFKEITGRDFEIGKGAKGFTAGGRSTARLSGSEASILGLCFRSALKDLFAPSCGFMVFDEPFDGCSASRTAEGIGALMQMRNQRILATHESLSESSADQVIELS